MKTHLLWSACTTLTSVVIAAPQPISPLKELFPRGHGYQTSKSWSGAVYERPPAGSNFNYVSGTFTVPSVSAGSPPDNSWGGYAWLGIDGWTTNSILQGGAGWGVSTGYSPYYYIWSEWYPNPPQMIQDFSVGPGDELKVSVTSTSDRDGYIMYENQNTEQTTTVSLAAPAGSTAALQRVNAAWVVEAYCSDSTCSGPAPFADFGTVTFSDCVAGLTTNDMVDLEDATVVDMTPSKAWAYIPNNSQVVISYR